MASIPDWGDEDPADFLMESVTSSAKKTSGSRKPDTKLTGVKLREYLSYDPDKIMMSLTRPNSGLKNLLNDRMLAEELVPLALKCFTKACSYEPAEESRNYLLSCILDSGFLASVTLQLLKYTKIPREFVDNTTEIVLSILKKLSLEDQKVTSICVLIQLLESRDDVSSETATKITHIRSIMSAREKIHEESRANRRYLDNEDNVPPEDFRILSIVPRECDIDVNRQPYLRKNRTDRRYDNHDHYLDVQFRLLREDLIAPLRESISELQTHWGATERSRSSPGYYEKVRLLRPVCRTNGLAYRIRFDMTRLSRVKWESSRRLIYGSLLCLSNDNFKSCVYGTVLNREDKKIQNGIVDICFEFSDVDELNDFVQKNRNCRFVMVESPSYFEAYKHVLRGLQRMGNGNFPFYRYIVECAVDVHPPAYTLKNGSSSVYDLRPVTDASYKFREDGSNHGFPDHMAGLQAVDIFQDADWPASKILNLDSSQSIALRNALTREFAIIQGPPGTGKTHLGLNILKVLLHNKNIWQVDENNTPVVVICYTNHALDQFLVGALDFFDGKMVRVGSRIKDDRLKQYSITDHRTRSRTAREVDPATHAARCSMKLELDDLKREIEETAVKLEVAVNEIITSICLQSESVIAEKHANQLSRDDVLVEWLGIRPDYNDRGGRGDQVWQHQREAEEVEVHQNAPDGRGDESDQDSDYDEADADADQPLDYGNTRLLDDDDFDDIFDLAAFDQQIALITSRITALDVSNLDRTPNEQDDDVSKRKLDYLRRLKLNIRRKLDDERIMSSDEVESLTNLRRLKYRDRWRLYRYWVQQFVNQVKAKLKDKEEEYAKKCKMYDEILKIEDKEIIKTATIAGFTTTGAAKYQATLSDIGPKIIIFEEAAEVLEGHIVASLCRNCQHAIFIGDHKQLRPNPTVHKLAKDFGLDISMFERLIGNGLPYDTLQLQHRMRPEISTIIHPIYPHLNDHEDVKKYEEIRGVATNVFFINHCQPDEENTEEKTRVNQFEGKYLKALCKYLLRQGYRQSRITILTTYSGQQQYVSSLLKTKYGQVRVATVDSFQGQENDIILLSLVRSSHEDGIGFLAKDNRLCVAFSRAKMGFYAIGNFEHIQKYSPLMKEMARKAHKQRIVDEALSLTCNVHGFITKASSPDHFKPSISSCHKPCNVRLKCGHQCKRSCHSDDTTHEETKCLEQCIKSCSNGHRCPQLCFQECEPCLVKVKKTLPKCGHEMDVPCSVEPWKVECTATMNKDLPCGHRGDGFCSESVNPSCPVNVELTRDGCGHTINIPCYQKDTDVCNHPCGVILKCGHTCRGTCSDCCKGKLHIPCQEKCNRNLICGHICTSDCSICPPCDQECINKCRHNGCRNKCGEACTPCNEACKWRCRHHTCTRRCSELCDRDRCDEPCRKILPCGHQCIGLCGEFCGESGKQLCRICNRTELERCHIWGDEDTSSSRYVYLEDCGHIFEVRGLDRFMDENLTEDNEIGMKRCPLCKTIIIKTQRYSNVVKQQFEAVHRIKHKIQGDAERINKLKRSIEEIGRSANLSLRSFVGALYKKDDIQSEDRLAAVVSQVNIYKNILSLNQKLDRTKRQLSLEDDEFQKPLRLLADLERWVRIRRSVLTEQEVEDAKARLITLRNLVTLSTGRAKAADKPRDERPPASFMTRLSTLIHDMEAEKDTYTDEQVTEMIETIDDYVPPTTLGVTNEERLEIVAAIGGRKGHWYQCRYGHYYSIDECGRPMETAECPECHEVIGGQSHELHDGNIEAPEIDDAEESLHTEETDFLYALQLQFGNF